ncbi:hypothetical protein [Acinetobacter haemolyticus]|uniref:hypothetical protein n=1 Tax=Acinetobacter haemolyticus TaxID=29430 RepID=UPI000D68672C|nr:hypothetical protein [Acinetobacter haemolyticus]
MIKEKLTLEQKQAFWTEQQPLFEQHYWLTSHFEYVRFDMEQGNYVVRDDIDLAFQDDADEVYHRVNTGWSMWKRAVNHMQKKLEGCVVVPKTIPNNVVERLRNSSYHWGEHTKDYFTPIYELMVEEAARGGNE